MESKRHVATKKSTIILLLPFIFWGVIFVIGPFAVLGWTSISSKDIYGVIDYQSFDLHAYQSLLKPVFLGIFFKTFLFAGLCTLGCLLLGYPLAFFLSRLKGTLRSWALLGILIPFWTSFLLRILAMFELFRNSDGSDGLLYTPFGVQIAMLYNYLPFAVLPLYASFTRIETSCLEAARDLGATSFQIFLKVILPLSQRGIATAVIFVFVPSLGEFLIPDLLGGGREFYLGTFLQNQFLSARNWPLGSAMICLLVFMSFVAIAFLKKATPTSASLFDDSGSAK